ncbi:MAG: LysM peptidoglycan-binding domain-containing protein [Myxococcales bacterium]|nr:LysM peptidoglycan-binding domain-containing protein [Myxococcales bacterium]
MRSSMLLLLGAVLLVPAAATTARAAETAGAEAWMEEPGAGQVDPASASAEPTIDAAEPAIAPGLESPRAAKDLEAAEGLGEAEFAPDGFTEGDDFAEADDFIEADDFAEVPEAADEAPVLETEEASLAADATLPTEVPVETSTPLGALGYDAQGHPGRIHIVVTGDTLWDISDAYLGTPWVWPSIWEDNRDIENPHMIHPGDHIWITPTEMRRVSSEEAQALLAGRAPAAPEVDVVEELPLPQAPEPQAFAATPDEPLTQLVNARERVGFITAETLAASASIVDNVTPRLMLGQVDTVYIGLGRGDVEVGDEFTIFREHERVVDPDTGRRLGYHVDILGWLEVTETHDETSVAEIRESGDPIEKGDRLMVRERVPTEIAVKPTPDGVKGKLSYFASSRTIMAAVDFVYLNRGALDGLEVGSPLEVYREAHSGKEAARGERVRIPDRVVAQLVVVKAEPETAVAFVTHSEGELEIGDLFRGATR